MWKVVLAQLLGAVTPTIMVTARTLAVTLRDKARKTDNPWDDVLADLLCGLLSVDGKE